MVDIATASYTFGPVATTRVTTTDPLAPFSSAVRDWFHASFAAPTQAQVEGWAAISGGHHTLIHAPTGSGKTLAAFLWCLDRLARDPSPPPARGTLGHVRVLYISPLKALTYDVERNLKAPLTGIGLAAQRLGQAPPAITVASRTGDTPADDRRRIALHPPDILITTPESLYLMLTSGAREVLRGVEHVIIDEVHAIAGTKRGSHLALSLERLECLRAPDARPPQRIGLSATQRPLEAIGRFMAGVGPGREVLRPAGLPDGTERPTGPRHEAIREHLTRRGASFYREVFAAAGGGRDREVLDALWDLVWAGEVTNDTFAPLQALRWKRSGGGNGARRPIRAGRLTALGPPEAAGRWSLVSPDQSAATPTERLHAVSLALLERHGVLTREAVAMEGIDGGFSAVYPILRAMEEAGRIRRGYFVDGLGAAQFALAGALDRLRSVRELADPPGSGAVHLLAAADPANPYGAAIAWPRRGEADRRPLQRAAGAYVVLVDGQAALYLERGGSTLQTLPASDDHDIALAATGALRALIADGRVRELVVRKVDGEDVAASPFRPVLLEAGFVAGYRGLVLRAARPVSAR